MSNTHGPARSLRFPQGRTRNIHEQDVPWSRPRRLPELLLSSGKTIAIISGAMAAAALIETLAPLHARRLDPAHLRANLPLTAITCVTNVVFNLPLAAGLVWAHAS